MIEFVFSFVFVAVAFCWLAYRFWEISGQMGTLQKALEKSTVEKNELSCELTKTREDLKLTRNELEKNRNALTSCTDAIHGK